jgi:hypothetical protein
MREGKNMGIMTTFKKPTLESRPLPLGEGAKAVADRTDTSMLTLH